MNQAMHSRQSIFSFNICRLIKLYILATLWSKLELTTGTKLSISNTVHTHKGSSNHALWDINLDAVDDSITWEASNLSTAHTVTDIEDTMCFAAIDDDNINPLALHNVSNDNISDKHISFNSKATEFGTDNCATHHIFSLLNLFTDIGLAPKIGVTGVAVSLMASGIGTTKFILTDDNGEKYKIQLKNIIYLPDSAKNLISTTQ